MYGVVFVYLNIRMSYVFMCVNIISYLVGV